MNTYKVVSESGVDVDGVHFEQGELLELSAESAVELVEAGSVVLDEVPELEEEEALIDVPEEVA